MSNVKCRDCGKVSGANEVKVVPRGNMIYEERCPHCGGEVDLEHYAEIMKGNLPHRSGLSQVSK